MKPKAFRLPDHVFPERYDVHVDARLTRDDFDGRVEIALRLTRATDAVVLHARDIDFKDITVEAGDRTLTGTAEPAPEQETVTLRFPEPVPEGNARLVIRYTGHVSRNMEGLYRAKDGPEECFATQCEETDARAIFPCFDEPPFKARFAWHVTTDAHLTVLANGPLDRVEDTGDGSRTWHFHATKPMSSYLAALTIGELESGPEKVVNDVPMRVWAVKGKAHMGDFAQDFANRLLPWFEDYFGQPYHFDKYDQVAVPGFAAGAMENSGLVLFRQYLLLSDPKTASWKQRKLIARVVAHEFAHMWFGNLVTMRWWDDLWLNEAFAEWMAHRAVHALDPDLEIWADFQAGKRQALVSDALESTHAIYSPVETPEEATELFDAITYEKGSAVMRMLENYLGEEAFRDGLRTYMAEFREGNARGDDLWRHLDQASGEPVGRIMDSWIKQGGYPVVTVSMEDTFGTARLHVKQRRFYSQPGAGSGRDPVWTVPLVVRWADDGGEHETRVLLSTREAVIPLEPDGDIRWVYANAQEIGFYRQNLSKVLLGRAVKNLKRLSPDEQMGLLDDQWSLARNGTQTMTRVLEVIQALTATQDHNVLEAVVGKLHAVEDMLAATGDEAAMRAFREWVKRSFRDALADLGLTPVDGESRSDSQRRVILLDTMARLGEDADTVQEATALADREMADAAAVDADLAPAVVRVAAAFGDAARFERHKETYEARRAGHSSPQETNRYLNTLPQYRDPALVERTLALMDEGVIPQEAVGPLLRLMFGERHAREHAWEYVKRRWQWIRETLGDMWTGFIVEASGHLPKEKREDVVRFYDANLGDVARQAYARALEAMDQRAEFQARVQDDLVGWFRKTAS